MSLLIGFAIYMVINTTLVVNLIIRDAWRRKAIKEALFNLGINSVAYLFAVFFWLHWKYETRGRSKNG